MKPIRWIVLIALTLAVTACPKYGFKPYLPEQYRGPAHEPDGTAGGIFTGKKGEYVIYGQ